MSGGARPVLALICLVAILTACTSNGDTVPIESALADNAGGLSITIDQPCPDGGAIDLEVVESESTIRITARFVEGPVIDCDGGAAQSDQRTTVIELETRVGDRLIINGSTGDEVPTTRP